MLFICAALTTLALLFLNKKRSLFPLPHYSGTFFNQTNSALKRGSTVFISLHFINCFLNVDWIVQASVDEITVFLSLCFYIYYMIISRALVNNDVNNKFKM